VRLAWTLGLLLLLPDFAGASAVQRARPAAARARHTARPSAAGPDLSASYSFLRAGEADLHGADVSASFPFWRSVRLLADLSVHSGSFGGVDLKQIDFMGGVRRVFRPGRDWRPFAQAMIGGARSTSKFADVLSSSQTAWGGALGAGTDYRLSRRWALRGQGDYLILHSGGGWDGDPRLSIGLAYRFAR
jgi:outer membrane protein with beta-barrel domain